MFLLNASCVLYYNTLGKGDAALSRFIPLADGAVLVLNPLPHHKTYRRFITRRTWRIASPPAPNHA